MWRGIGQYLNLHRGAATEIPTVTVETILEAVSLSPSPLSEQNQNGQTSRRVLPLASAVGSWILEAVAVDAVGWRWWLLDSVRFSKTIPLGSSRSD